ncbi:inter-alpha-trypsin inhibitor heavy chain H4-like isoform X2 [Bacillus rossius redtenbacheri]|uniref:inter-alpha-trypsin inhibitor heavy chain H4-like isoform X2 n=1 Tax=Bacillus rossius redtenbacheri TaxID=93214 RepID=UPI002FDC8BC9
MMSSAVLLAALCWALGAATPQGSPASLLLRRLETPGDQEATPTTTQATPKLPRPELYSLHVVSHVTYRFATTVISSRVANPANASQEVFFSVVLPETAFISGFLMEVDGKQYDAYVKEKAEARRDYDQALVTGQAAAHVALSARDSNRFTVSVNVEPQSKVTFNLTYEELLTRRLGTYNHVINLYPGQVVRDLQVDVFIKEARNITVLRIPELQSGNEIDPEEDKKANPLATVERPSPAEAHVRFAPSAGQQLALGQEGGGGLRGQLVVRYDVQREPQAGEVLVNDGYFVHFFAPAELPPLRKHAVFVLDVSGSMEGRKIDQLKEAMSAILDELREGDFFNLVEFSYSVTVWNLDSAAASSVFSPLSAYAYDDEPRHPTARTPAFPATPEYVRKAKDIVAKMRAGGGTNIHDTLKTAIAVAREGLANVTVAGDPPEPIIVFLTDGEPTVGEVRPAKILSTVGELNDGPRAAIFSLAFGDDADVGFLKKLSLRNSGFARKIYEAADAALQLRDFYRQVASPLLANVTFTYPPGQVEEGSLTRRRFHTLFSGAELVVAGRRGSGDPGLAAEVSGLSLDGPSLFPAGGTRPAGTAPLERLWAHLTVRQLLEDSDALGGDPDNTTEKGEAARRRALQLALKYSFVTPLTSLVIVKPNETKSVDSEAIHPANDGGHYALPLHGGPFDRLDSPAYPSYLTPPQPMGRPDGAPVMFSDQFHLDEAEDALDGGGADFLVTLDDLAWLHDATNGTDTILLPVGANGTEEVFRLAFNQTEPSLVACSTTSGTTGVCRHMAHCVLDSFRQDVRAYLRYFCSIGRYAGVCCPDHIHQEQDTTTEADEVTTLAPEQDATHSS